MARAARPPGVKDKVRAAAIGTVRPASHIPSVHQRVDELRDRLLADTQLGYQLAGVAGSSGQDHQCPEGGLGQCLEPPFGQMVLYGEPVPLDDASLQPRMQDRLAALASSWEGSGALLANGVYYDWGYNAAR